MSASARLALYIGLLALVVAAAAGVGVAVGPLEGGDGAREHAAGKEDTSAMNQHESNSAGPETHGHGASRATGGAALGGLAVARDGYRLVFAETTLPAARAVPIRFRVVAQDGGTVRDFDLEGGVRMHLILVRRDLTGYQHMHPTLAPDGSFTAEIVLPSPGVWRAFADFERHGRKVVLGMDLYAPGEFVPERLPASRSRASAEGYDVELAAEPRAGQESELAFRVRRAGVPVALEPYLGARGHLVALREGDLGYLHVHPLAEGPPGEVAFAASFPTAGRYRLFLQFNDAGRIHTAAFTLGVRR